MKNYKSSVIGCGRMGAFTSKFAASNAPEFWFPLSHCEALVAHNKIDLVALSDINEEKLLAAANNYKVLNTYIDSSELIENVRPEILCVATRTIGRSEIINCGLDCGIKAFHVEKPLCNSVEEMLKLENKIFGKDIVITLGTLRRYFRNYKLAKQISYSGEYGKVREVRVNFGLGNLLWAHPHSIDLILFGADHNENNKVMGVQSKLSKIETGNKSSEIVSDPVVLSSSIYFENGIIGNITQSPGCDFCIVCDKAAITVRADGESVDIYISKNKDYNSFINYELPKNPHLDFESGTLAPVSFIVDFLDKKKNIREKSFKIKNDIFTTQKIIFAALQSHSQDSKIVHLEDLNNNWSILGKTGDLYA